METDIIQISRLLVQTQTEERTTSRTTEEGRSIEQEAPGGMWNMSVSQMYREMELLETRACSEWMTKTEKQGDFEKKKCFVKFILTDRINLHHVFYGPEASV